MNQLIASIVCETYRALKEDADIQVAIAPGSINVVVSGGNSGGPVVCTGPNVNYGSGKALLQ